MTVYDWAWGGLIAAGLTFEAVALKRKVQGDTLSEFTRKVFRTGDPEVPGSGTRWGRIAFLVGWVGFAAWYTWHILWQVW
jgi:hypothetical protein